MAFTAPASIRCWRLQPRPRVRSITTSAPRMLSRWPWCGNTTRHTSPVLSRWAQEARLDASERLCGYLKELTSAFEHLGCKHGCLIGKFSLELAPASEGFGALLSSMLVGWKASIEQIIADGQTNRLFRDDLPSSNLADLVLSGIQGSVLLGLAHRDSAALRNLEVTIPALLARPVAR